MAVKKPTKTTESTTSSKSLESKKIEEKIFSKNVNVESNKWRLNDVTIFKIKDGIFKKRKSRT